MFYNLLINNIKRPINEFNASVVYHKELNRMKLATTRLPMESLEQKLLLKNLCGITCRLPSTQRTNPRWIKNWNQQAQTKTTVIIQSIHCKWQKTSRTERPTWREFNTNAKKLTFSKNNKGDSYTWLRADSSSTTAAVNSSTNTHKQTHQTVNHNHKNRISCQKQQCHQCAKAKAKAKAKQKTATKNKNEQYSGKHKT